MEFLFILIGKGRVNTKNLHFRVKGQGGGPGCKILILGSLKTVIRIDIKFWGQTKFSTDRVFDGHGLCRIWTLTYSPQA